jgi:diguanylate cyclase (GGDEF)-like protein/PAS domain S-box-containing protein
MPRELLDEMDRPGRVFLSFFVLVFAYLVVDVTYLAFTTGVSAWSALVAPASYDAFTRVVVLVLALAAALAGELLTSRYRRARKQLETERSRLRALYDDNPSAIVTLDRDMRISYVNRRAESLVGVPKAQLEGKRCHEAIVGSEGMCDGCLVKQVFLTGTPASRIKHETTVGERENWLSQLWYPLHDAKGKIDSVVEIASDISELRLDSLTSLPNRLLFRDRLDVALAAARRHRRSLAVLYLDLDDFKGVNDRLGHAAGDTLLKELGVRLRGVVRTDETLARLGGDEFVLLIPDLESPSDVERVAQRITHAMREPFLVKGQPIAVSVSVGACIFAGGTATAEELLQSADTAMYDAKKDSGSSYRVTWCGPFSERRHVWAG